jgi:hypothetical protein
VRKSCTPLSARACVRAFARVAHAGFRVTVFRVFQARGGRVGGRGYVCVVCCVGSVRRSPGLRAEPACSCVRVRLRLCVCCACLRGCFKSVSLCVICACPQVIHVRAAVYGAPSTEGAMSGASTCTSGMHARYASHSRVGCRALRVVCAHSE